MLLAKKKKEGEIIGITKTTSVQRWASSYNLRAHIAAETRALYNVGLDDQLSHKESTMARRHLEAKDEEGVYSTLQHFNIFFPRTSSEELV